MHKSWTWLTHNHSYLTVDTTEWKH